VDHAVQQGQRRVAGELAERQEDAQLALEGVHHQKFLHRRARHRIT
jgi:hypothetical protein